MNMNKYSAEALILLMDKIAKEQAESGLDQALPGQDNQEEE